MLDVLRYIIWRILKGGGGSKTHVIPAQEGTNNNEIAFTVFDGTYAALPNESYTYTLVNPGEDVRIMTYVSGATAQLWMWASDETFKVKRTPSTYTFTASSYEKDGKTVYYYRPGEIGGTGEIGTDAATPLVYNENVDASAAEDPWSYTYVADTAWLMVYGGY